MIDPEIIKRVEEGLSLDRIDKRDIQPESYLDVLEDLRDLRKAAAPFITHSARLSSQSTTGKAYVLIEVPVDDILNLRRELMGTTKSFAEKEYSDMTIHELRREQDKPIDKEPKS